MTDWRCLERYTIEDINVARNHCWNQHRPLRHELERHYSGSTILIFGASDFCALICFCISSTIGEAIL